MITIQETTGGDEVYCRLDGVAQALLESGWFYAPSDEMREAIAMYGVHVAVGAKVTNYETYLGVKVIGDMR